MDHSPEVDLVVATPADDTLLQNLLQLYIHDLSEVFPDVELGADGRFRYDALGSYWSDPERRRAFLIRHEGRVAGFALAQRGSPASDDPEVWDVAEFFVLRRFRRRGVARRAARVLWGRLPGRWIVRVSVENRGALSFWPGVVAEAAKGEVSEREHPGRSHMLRVFSFEVA